MIFLNSSITKTVEATRTTTNQSWDSRVVVFSKSPTTTSPKGRPNVGSLNEDEQEAHRNHGCEIDRSVGEQTQIEDNGTFS